MFNRAVNRMKTRQELTVVIYIYHNKKSGASWTPCELGVSGLNPVFNDGH